MPAPLPRASAGPILGHGAVLDRLWGALARDGLHHAYLFEGPSGVGKRTVAIRLAMAANCTAATPAPPCGTCPTCKQILLGHHPDVLTVEPLPDRATPIISVDQIREVVRMAGYHRFSARRRFVIVDPAEAMREEAANSLLKTLEEPPQGTGFVLVATHASALLPTIVSRCQRVRFAAVPEETLVPWLASHGVSDPVGAARASLGCPGVALELGGGGLDQRRELRTRLLGAVAGSVKDVFDLSEDVAKGKRQDWRSEVDALLEVVEDLLRDVTIHASGGRAALLDGDVPDVVDAWRRALWPGGVERCARAIRDARDDLEVNVSGRLVLDAFLSRIRAEVRGEAT